MGVSGTCRSRPFAYAGDTMKEDILEQIVDEYLMHAGYLTTHNVKFRPARTHNDYESQHDSVHSDIDVIGFHPKKQGNDRVIVVSCKSWQDGIDLSGDLERIAETRKNPKRPTWKSFRELCKPKWSQAFIDKVEEVTGTRKFTYWTAVTHVKNGDKAQWEKHQVFIDALEGNPIKVVTFDEMLDEVWNEISKTPAATEIGRMIQLMKASRWSPPLAAKKSSRNA
jgi:hypothetical protein